MWNSIVDLTAGYLANAESAPLTDDNPRPLIRW
jgi:hypothetical protein